jgi:hypothetical protein
MEIEGRRIMTVKKSTPAFGWRAYGLGMMALGLASLAFGEFDPGQSVPVRFPYRTVLAYVAGVFIVVAGAAVEGRRTRVWGAAALTGYYVVFVLLLMNGRLLLTDYAVYGLWHLRKHLHAAGACRGWADRLCHNSPNRFTDQ